MKTSRARLDSETKRADDCERKCGDLAQKGEAERRNPMDAMRAAYDRDKASLEADKASLEGDVASLEGELSRLREASAYWRMKRWLKSARRRRGSFKTASRSRRR